MLVKRFPIIKHGRYQFIFFKTATITNRIPRAIQVSFPVASVKFGFQVIRIVCFMNCNNTLDETVTSVGHNYVTCRWNGITCLYHQVIRVDEGASNVIGVSKAPVNS